MNYDVQPPIDGGVEGLNQTLYPYARCLQVLNMLPISIIISLIHHDSPANTRMLCLFNTMVVEIC